MLAAATSLLVASAAEGLPLMLSSAAMPAVHAEETENSALQLGKDIGLVPQEYETSEDDPTRMAGT